MIHIDQGCTSFVPLQVKNLPWKHDGGHPETDGGPFKQAANLIINLCTLKCRPGESGGWLGMEVGRSLREPQ